MAGKTAEEKDNISITLPGRMIYVVSASPWKRAFAFLIDFFIVDIFIFGAYSGIIDNNYSFSSIFNNGFSANILLVAFFMLFFSYVYFFSLEYILGQTIGKYILGLYVVDNGFNSISFGQALLRNIELLPVFPFYLFAFIDFFYFLAKSKRTLDFLSRTDVIEKGIY